MDVEEELKKDNNGAGDSVYQNNLGKLFWDKFEAKKQDKAEEIKKETIYPLTPEQAFSDELKKNLMMKAINKNVIFKIVNDENLKEEKSSVVPKKNIVPNNMVLGQVLSYEGKKHIVGQKIVCFVLDVVCLNENENLFCIKSKKIKAIYE